MSFVYELKNCRLRTVKTCLLGLIFIGLGLFIASLGPALLDLQQLSHTTIVETAVLLPARSIGYALGSLIAGIIGDRIDQQIVIIYSMIASIVMTICFPLFPNIYTMYSIMGLAGIANGCIDTIGNCWIIHIWGKENPPFMQIIHFTYGLGAFIAPFIVEPFLARNPNLESTSLNNSTSNATSINSEDLMIQWSFIIISFYYAFVVLIFIFVYIRYPDNTIHPSRLKNNSSNELDGNTKIDKFQLNTPLKGFMKYFIIAIATVLMHAYIGVEISFGSLLSPFAVKSDLHFTTSQGSFLTSSYWATYTFSRIFSLIAIIYLSPRTLLIINFGVIMFANFILVCFGNQYEWALWAGSAIMGLGCSSVFATVFAFVEQLTPVTSGITAGFLIAACFGELIIPVTVSSFLEQYQPVFLWTVLFYSVLSLIFLILLFVIQHKLLKKQKNQQIQLRTNYLGMSNLAYKQSD